MRTTRWKLYQSCWQGLDAKKNQNLPAKGKVFLLDIPFYRTRRGEVTIVLQGIYTKFADAQRA